MDPNQALIDADQALSEGRYAVVVDAITTYYQWRIRGGFEPRMASIRSETRGDRIAERIIDRAIVALRQRERE